MHRRDKNAPETCTTTANRVAATETRAQGGSIKLAWSVHARKKIGGGGGGGEQRKELKGSSSRKNTAKSASSSPWQPSRVCSCNGKALKKKI